jgi:hypothetical protein
MLCTGDFLVKIILYSLQIFDTFSESPTASLRAGVPKKNCNSKKKCFIQGFKFLNHNRFFKLPMTYYLFIISFFFPEKFLPEISIKYIPAGRVEVLISYDDRLAVSLFTIKPKLL